MEHVYALARAAGHSREEALAQVSNLGADLPAMFRAGLHGEWVLGHIDEAQVLLAGHWFPTLVATVNLVGALEAVDQLDTLAGIIREHESFRAGRPGHVGSSLAPFARGMVFLACAEALKGRGAGESQRVFGVDGLDHAAGLRQALNPTLNRQQKAIRQSLDLLKAAPTPMAMEAWRALVAWAMATPTLRSLAQEFGMKRAMTGPALLDAVEDELGSQFLLQAQLLREHWPTNVFGGTPDLEQEAKAAYQDLILMNLGGREVVLPAVQLMGFWPAMMGRLGALEMLEAFMHQLLSQGIPADLATIHLNPDLLAHLGRGIPMLRRALFGTVEGQIADMKIQEFLETWEGVNESFRMSGSEGVSSEIFFRMRA